MLWLGLGLLAFGVVLQTIGGTKSLGRHQGIHTPIGDNIFNPSRWPKAWARMMHVMHSDPVTARWLFPAYAFMALGIVLVFSG